MRLRSYVLRDEGEDQHLAQDILKRRAGSPQRIGVAYRIRERIDPEVWAGFYEAVGPVIAGQLEVHSRLTGEKPLGVDFPQP